MRKDGAPSPVRKLTCLYCGKVEDYSGRCHSNRRFCSDKCRADGGRRRYYLREYGITHEQYDLILSSQNGKCAICAKDVSWSKRESHLDHNHETGTIRGVLCSSCNRGIGLMKDSAFISHQASAYLYSHMPLQDLITEASK